MKRVIAHIVIFCCISFQTIAQWEFDGQLIGVGSFSPQNDLPVFFGARYLPEISFEHKLDSSQKFDFEVSANISAFTLSNPRVENTIEGNVNPYRAWARYSGKQFELRAGLQKIDFGSATLLRPLQWFNEIDPRDPLQLTNGVYGLLSRYYFLNNANIWVWGLMGNQKTRGLDALETYPRVPEIGGRVQVPVPKGQIALSYHHRNALIDDIQIPENRIGLDGKWDLEIGLWSEISIVQKSQNIGLLTHQTLFNVGTDYTLGLGNRLNVMAEHLLYATSEKALGLDNSAQVTAVTASYPLSFFDSITAVATYVWSTKEPSFFINYEHQFPKISAYFMAFYNPETQVGIRQNDLVNNFAGPGIRVMAVYNH